MGAGGIEEISPDRRGTQGTEGMTEERSSPQKERLSPQKEQLRNILQTRRRKNSLRKEGDSSEGMRNSSVPQTGSSDSSQSSSEGTKEAFGRFAEEMKELRKTMQLVKQGPRDDRPAVSELMDRELMMPATPIIRKVVLNHKIARPVFSQCLTLTVVNV